MPKITETTVQGWGRIRFSIPMSSILEKDLREVTSQCLPWEEINEMLGTLSISVPEEHAPQVRSALKL